MQMYLINEVAKMHRVTKRTLLHYERIGIFKPYHVDEKTGYRYYTYDQFPFLKQIIYLKDLGFSLDEIKILLDNRQFETLIEGLNHQLLKVQEEKTEAIRKEKDIRYLIDYYEQVRHLDERDLYKPGIKLFNERIVFYELAKENTEKGVMFAYRKLLRKLIDKDVFSQMPYGTIILNETNFYERMGSFISLPHTFGFKQELTLPSGKYAYMYKKGGYYDPESFKILLAWIEANGYEVAGDGFDFSLVDYTFTNSSKEMIQELQIRVK